MTLSRRDCCLLALGAAVPLTYWAARPPGSRGPAGTANFANYHSTLVNDFTPQFIMWNGHKWRCAMGSVWNAGMDHSLRLTPQRARFEIRQSETDRGPRDPQGKRRSELRIPKEPRLPNGVPLWGAMSFLHHRWDDPEGMARNWGGVHGQLHIGSTFGGSPAVAFRRTRRGDFAVTTRGENDRESNRRYEGPLPFDQVHNLVYRVVLDPIDATLNVWLNGQMIVDVRGASIGTSRAECYWSLGVYYAGGISCPIVAEYGDHIYPGTADLSRRIGFRPDWRVATA